MNQTVTQYQCTCEQSFCVFMWKLGPGLIVSWAAGRAYRDTEVHLSPINLCLFLCVSVDAGDELWTESRLAHMLSAEPWNDSLKKVSFFFLFSHLRWLVVTEHSFSSSLLCEALCDTNSGVLHVTMLVAKWRAINTKDVHSQLLLFDTLLLIKSF